MSNAQHTIATAMFRWTMAGAARQGLDQAGLLRRAGVSPDQAETRQRLPAERYVALLRTLRRTMRDEFWGLASKPVPVGTFTAICRDAVHAVTLREALERSLAGYRRVLDDFSPRLTILDGQACVRLHPRDCSNPLATYAECIFTYHMARLMWWLVGRRFPLCGVSFRHAELPWSGETRLLLQVGCNYEVAEGQLWFDARCLNIPVIQNLDRLHTFTQDACHHLIRYPRNESGIVDTVCSRLRRGLSGDIPSLKELAQSMHLTESTLKRRLEQEGSHFRALKDLMRKDTACNLLMQTTLPLQEIAERVGFSDPAAFSRAFKRWTHMPPGEFRGRRLAGLDFVTTRASAVVPGRRARHELFDQAFCT